MITTFTAEQWRNIVVFCSEMKNATECKEAAKDAQNKITPTLTCKWITDKQQIAKNQIEIIKGKEGDVPQCRAWVNQGARLETAFDQFQIWKYSLSKNAPSDVVIKAPIVRMLSVAIQDTNPVAYALVDTAAPERDVHLAIRGTGHKLGVDPKLAQFLGTLEIRDEGWFFHVFEILKKE